MGINGCPVLSIEGRPSGSPLDGTPGAEAGPGLGCVVCFFWLNPPPNDLLTFSLKKILSHSIHAPLPSGGPHCGYGRPCRTPTIMLPQIIQTVNQGSFVISSLRGQNRKLNLNLNPNSNDSNCTWSNTSVRLHATEFPRQSIGTVNYTQWKASGVH